MFVVRAHAHFSLSNNEDSNRSSVSLTGLACVTMGSYGCDDPLTVDCRPEDADQEGQYSKVLEQAPKNAVDCLSLQALYKFEGLTIRSGSQMHVGIFIPVESSETELGRICRRKRCWSQQHNGWSSSTYWTFTFPPKSGDSHLTLEDHNVRPYVAATIKLESCI